MAGRELVGPLCMTQMETTQGWALPPTHCESLRAATLVPRLKEQGGRWKRRDKGELGDKQAKLRGESKGVTVTWLAQMREQTPDLRPQGGGSPAEGPSWETGREQRSDACAPCPAPRRVLSRPGFLLYEMGEIIFPLWLEKNP